MNIEAVLLQGNESLRTLYQMVLDGGPLIVPIGVCSVLAFGYAVDRFLGLRRNLLMPNTILNQLRANVQEGDIAAAVDACEKNGSPLAKVLGAGLSKVGDSLSEVEKASEDAGKREVARLSANLRPLQVIASIAPLLGLLGTVWGMIEAFNKIAGQDGMGRPELLAGGISQALITTAAGLAVAIPTHILVHYFRARIDAFARRSEEAYTEIVEEAARLVRGRAA